MAALAVKQALFHAGLMQLSRTCLNSTLLSLKTRHSGSRTLLQLWWPLKHLYEDLGHINFSP